jgi:Flp pilus assembly protein TadG
MILHRWNRDEGGATAVEFALTAPAFFALLFAVIEAGLLLWTQIGLQHGAEMAARCASIDTSVCGNASQIQSYAAQKAYGLNPAPSTFTVSSLACGQQVSATYQFPLLTKYFGMSSLQLTAQSCFPN